jgi:GGDEF domain-containing protein
MTSDSLEQLLDEFDEAKRSFGTDTGARVEKLLARVAKQEFQDVESLIRFHEALLFICAYPQSNKALQLAEAALASFADHVERLRLSGEDFTPFDYIEYSGIAGTVLHGTYSYGIARWLVDKHRRAVEVDWERLEKKERLGLILPQVIPLLAEDSLVEANVPYLDWIGAAKKRGTSDLAWIIESFEQSGLSEKEKSTLYDSLELWIRWEMGRARTSRTLNKLRPRKIFYHTQPLIRRNEVSLAREINSPLQMKKLSPTEGKTILDMCRDTTCVRYRELYGIAYGDPSSVVGVDVGRGVEIFLWGLPPERRLPLRAYHAGFTLKNGVPINYIEGISIFERMELGFNTFYTYREGETAWVYAQALRFLHQLVGVTCFSIDPYQIGFNNDEALESGAFWFYRKLGFRPTESELAKLVEAEEKKIAANREYRTPIRVLKTLSKGYVIYELPGTRAGDWDRFKIRNLGLAVQRRAAKEFNGHPEAIRASSIKQVARALDIRIESLNEFTRRAFDNLAPVLALIPDLARWTGEEKSGLIEIIRAKMSRHETRYARLLQKHKQLRDAIIKLGS